MKTKATYREAVVTGNLVAQYRTLASNSPSLAIANRLGFERYATSLVICMPPSGSSA